MASGIQTYDAIVIGAGFSGMYTLKALRDRLGLRVRVYEAGETVGGTWYWNRYPGARCDSDSYIYCFTWDKQLLQEWEWSERYPEQPEILRYLEHVAERHDLKRDIQFNTRVTGAEFDESNNLWCVHTDKGESARARYLITAVGSLSDTNLPQFKGLEKFQGKWCHTSRFSHDGIDSRPRGWQWSVRALPPYKPFQKSRSRPNNSQYFSAPPTTACRRAIARWTPNLSKCARPTMRASSNASANRSSASMR